MKGIALTSSLLLSFVSSACVGPQQMTLLETEQRRLRTENRDLRNDLDAVRVRLADAHASLEEMQSQLIALREKADEMLRQRDRQAGESPQLQAQKTVELENRITRINDELRAQGALLKAREQELQVLREAVVRATGGSDELSSLQRGDALGSPEKPAAKPVDPARVDYMEARKALEDKDYRGAIARFKEFIKRHPSSEYADNAQYWIGEAYYALRQFDQAILEFDIVRRKYPKGDKVPAALLKQGFAFAELGDKIDARLILQELIARYPRSQEAVLAREKVKALES